MTISYTTAGAGVAFVALVGLVWHYRRRSKQANQVAAEQQRTERDKGGTSLREPGEGGGPEVDYAAINIPESSGISPDFDVQASGTEGLDLSSGYVAAAELSGVLVTSALESFTVLKSVGSLAAQIYTMYLNVKANHRKCRRLGERALALQSSLARLGKSLKNGK
eukprot:gene13441-15883_t